jgi:recombination protein RecT
MANETALVLINPKTIHSDLERMKPEMERALPSHIKADRMARIALTQLRMNPQLFNCTRESFFGALLTASQLGFEPGVNGQCYLIPYKKNVKINGQWQEVTICTLVPGWKGYIDLVARSERASAWTGAVRLGDHFEYELGSNPKLEHRPGDKDTGNFTHVYAVGWIKGAQWPIIEVQSRAKVESHLATYNKVGDRHYALANENNLEMYGRKVALLQVIKYLPSSVEMRDATALDLSASEGRQNLTIDMALNHDLESGGEDSGDAEELAEKAALNTKIDALFSELGTAGPTAAKQRAKYINDPKGLIEWLEAQVAKKRNDGSKPKDAEKKPTAAEPKAEESGKPQEPARIGEIFGLLGWNADTQARWRKANENLSDEQKIAKLEKLLDDDEPNASSPAASAKPQSKPAPPPIDTEGWA